MDSLTAFVLSGLLGGLLLALLMAWLQRSGRRPRNHVPDRGRLSTDVINVSRIRVAGVGGLGLVAMAAAVALSVPRISQTLALGLTLGVVLAAVLIARRWRQGAMPSSGRRSGANTMLSIDAPDPGAGDGQTETKGPSFKTAAVQLAAPVRFDS